MIWKPYTVEWDPSAERDLRKLDAGDFDRFVGAVFKYANTGCGLVKPLRGADRGWLRLRIGGWRVIFRFDEGKHAIVVSRVSTRGGVYK